MSEIHRAIVTIEMVGFNPILAKRYELSEAVIEAIDTYDPSRDDDDRDMEPLKNISISVDAKCEGVAE